jgi:hypothetical protein
MATDKKILLVFPSADDLERTIVWPCQVAVPKDGGAVEVQEIDAAFTIPTEDELKDYAVATFTLGRAASAALLEKHLKDFPGVKDDTGALVPFDKAKPVMLARPYVVDGLVSGLYNMARGRAAKN